MDLLPDDSHFVCKETHQVIARYRLVEYMFGGCGGFVFYLG